MPSLGRTRRPVVWALALLLAIMPGCTGGREASTRVAQDPAPKYYEGALNYTTDVAVMEASAGPAMIAFRVDLPKPLWTKQDYPGTFSVFFPTTFRVPLRLELSHVARNAYYLVEVFEVKDNAISTPRIFYGPANPGGPIVLNLDRYAACAAEDVSLLIVAGAEGAEGRLKVRFGVPQNNELPSRTRSVRPALTGEGPRISFAHVEDNHDKVGHNVSISDGRKFAPVPPDVPFLAAQASGALKVAAQRLRPGLVYSTFSYDTSYEMSSIAYRATLDSVPRDHAWPSGTYGASVDLFGAARTNVSAEVEVTTTAGVGAPRLDFLFLSVPLDVETMGLRVAEAFQGVSHSPRAEPPSSINPFGSCA